LCVSISLRATHDQNLPLPKRWERLTQYRLGFQQYPSFCEGFFFFSVVIISLFKDIFLSKDRGRPLLFPSLFEFVPKQFATSFPRTFSVFLFRSPLVYLIMVSPSSFLSVPFLLVYYLPFRRWSATFFAVDCDVDPADLQPPPPPKTSGT